MTRLALVKLADNSVVKAPIAEGERVELPGVGFVSPAQAGWVGGGNITYDYVANEDSPEGVMQITDEGPAQYRLVAIVDAEDPPEGKRRVWPPNYVLAGDIVVETFMLEDLPAPVEITPAEKLAAAGLTVEDLRSLLGLP